MPDAAYRSLVAFWLGGAEATPEQHPAYGSMLAFWMGGVGKGRPAVPTGKGKTVGGKHHLPVLLRMIASENYNRSLLDAENMRVVREAMLKRAVAGAWLRKLEADHQQKCLEWAAYSVVLTEI